jgi:hypothetical protein
MSLDAEDPLGDFFAEISELSAESEGNAAQTDAFYSVLGKRTATDTTEPGIVAPSEHLEKVVKSNDPVYYKLDAVESADSNTNTNIPYALTVILSMRILMHKIQHNEVLTHHLHLHILHQ